MKKAILTSLVSLVAFTSVMSAEIKPAEARFRGNGRIIYRGARGAYNSSQQGDSGGFLLGVFLVVGGIVSSISQSK